MSYRRRRRKRVAWVVVVGMAASTLAGCTSEGVIGGASTLVPDVEGVYTVTLVYGDNGCKFDDWQEGSVVPGVVLDVDQDADRLAVQVEGLIGGVLALIHGSNVYSGRMVGRQFDMSIEGQNETIEGACSYVLDNRASGRFDDATMEGELEFVTDGGADPDCATVQCSSRISFSGTRTSRLQGGVGGGQ